jgi:Fic family protein
MQGYSLLKDEIVKKLLGDKESKDALIVHIEDNKNMGHKSVFVPDKSQVKSQKAPIVRSTIKKPKSKKVAGEGNGNMTRKADVQKILSQKGPMRLVQLISNFPSLNKRTLRRDLADMVAHNVLERYDVGKLTFYKIKSV